MPIELDSMWVYAYKFNKNGKLVKCKARLVVRGDQQIRHRNGDTYTATLASRSFRTFMAVVARFDLGLRQYDAVNAFVNAALPSPRGWRNFVPRVLRELRQVFFFFFFFFLRCFQECLR